MVRLRVRLHAREIDDRLVAGELPEESMEGRARSDMVLAPRNRASVANALRRLVEISGDHKVLGAGLHVKRRELLETRPLILSLADEIETEPGASARRHPGRPPDHGRGIAHLLARKDGVEAAVNQARAALHMG